MMSKLSCPKTDRDPRLQEFLQAIVHAVDNKRVTMNCRFFGGHVFLYSIGGLDTFLAEKSSEHSTTRYL
jgi:hypothetical protein